MVLNKLRSTNPNLDGIVPYDPKYLPADVMLSANENPDGLSAGVAGAVSAAIARVQVNRYPDPLANDLRDEVASAYGVERENVLVGNGGDELLFDIAFAWGGPGRTMLDCPPTFSVYAANARLCGTTVVNVERVIGGGRSFCSVDEEAVLERVSQGDIDYLTICTPNNPTGELTDLSFIERLLDATDALVLVDEAYGEFAKLGTSALPLLSSHKNLAILHTFSKAYSIAGVRVGYVLAHPEVISELKKVRQPYSVDAFSQAAALEVFKSRDVFAARTAKIVSERERVLATLRDFGDVEVWPSSANYLFMRVPKAAYVWERLLAGGVLVRDFSTGELTRDCLRVSIGSPEQNDRFISLLGHILDQEREYFG